MRSPSKQHYVCWQVDELGSFSLILWGGINTRACSCCHAIVCRLIVNSDEDHLNYISSPSKVATNCPSLAILVVFLGNYFYCDSIISWVSVAGDLVHSVREFVQQLGWTQALETLIDNSKDHVQVRPVYIPILFALEHSKGCRSPM